MTGLAQLVWDCRTIGGMDKLVLMGWAEQVPDGSDLAYASKETVAELLELGISTVKRHTKALLKRGVLVDTLGRKNWEHGWTPIFQVNLESLMVNPSKLTGFPDKQAVQIDPQGSNGSRFSVSSSCSPSPSGGFSSFCSESSGQEPVAGKSKEVGKTENRKPQTVEPKPSPEPTPNLLAQRKGKSCPDCKEPMRRDVNHFLNCPVAKGRSTLDEYAGDMLPIPDPNSYGGGVMPINPDGSIDMDKWAYGREARQPVEERAEQKSVKSIAEEGRARTMTTPFAQPPVAPAPQPQDEHCEFCQGRCSCNDPAPPQDERPTSIAT